MKASGYIQSWKQRELSKPVFSVKPTRAWDSETYKYACEAKRQADVYVFCLHNYEYRDEGLNPLDMNQWDEVSREHHTSDHRNAYEFDFITLKRRDPA